MLRVISPPQRFAGHISMLKALKSPTGNKILRFFFLAHLSQIDLVIDSVCKELKHPERMVD